MKNLFMLSIVASFLVMSCNTTKKTQPVLDVEDADVMVDHDEDGVIASTMAISEFLYYEVTTNENGEEVFNEKRVIGDGTNGVNADNVPTLQIIESGTDRVINCIERQHPSTGLNVFVTIGGGSDVRER